MYDVFLSYEHKSKAIADTLVSLMERHNIRCWYAPRDVIGDYATSIVEAIEQCSVFVVILNEHASRSPHVLNEVEMAYKRIVQDGFTIIPFRVSDDVLSQAMEYYVKRLHWIDAHSAPLEEAAKKLIENLKNVLQKEDSDKPSLPERTKNAYFRADDVKESKRLQTQQTLLKSFDADIYARLLEGKENVKVLDLGSNTGEGIMERLGRHPAVERVVGIEYDAETVKLANERFSQENAVFYQADLEGDDIKEVLASIIEELGIPGFDFLNVSMLMLHLKNPAKVLKAARRVMNEGAVLFVRDIDDGLNIAYPDQEGMFERVFRIVEQCPPSGYRKSARQIYHYLHKIGAKDIVLERIGPHTIGMDFRQRTALFDTYFSFIPEDLKITLESEADTEALDKEYKWLLSVYDELETEFCDQAFFFQLGMMVFTANF